MSRPPAVHDPLVLERLLRYDSCTLANAIETFEFRSRDEGFMSHDIRAVLPELPRVIGYAATATIRARGRGHGDQTRLLEHVLEVPEPRMVVVQDLDDPKAHGSLWGEVNATIFKRLGCVGVVTDGCVRDLDEVRQIGFQFFAPAVCVSHAWVRVEAAGLPVQVGGLTVAPGDLLFGDKHGVLHLPHELVPALADAADRVIAREQELLSWVRSEAFDPQELIARRQVQH